MSNNEGTNGMFACTARRGWLDGALMGAAVLALWGFLFLGVIAKVTLPLSTWVAAPGRADAAMSAIPHRGTAIEQAAFPTSRPSALMPLDRSQRVAELAASACAACQDCLEEVARAPNAGLGH